MYVTANDDTDGHAITACGCTWLSRTTYICTSSKSEVSETHSKRMCQSVCCYIFASTFYIHVLSGRHTFEVPLSVLSNLFSSLNRPQKPSRKHHQRDVCPATKSRRPKSAWHLPAERLQHLRRRRNCSSGGHTAQKGCVRTVASC